MQFNRTKPCLALMGEFSAGKTTLANLLIGSIPLPVRIIATQLPPVKISHGTDAPYRVDLAGERWPLDLNDMDDLDMDQTRYIQFFSPEDLLQHCDYPNMTADVWERMIDQADGVIWCSHAVQAWRQSEAAVWDSMPPDLYDKSLLLLTQIDKVTSSTDRTRIVTRVTRETAGLFRAVLPISLLTATQETTDPDRWAQSGAGDLVTALIALLNDLSSGRKQAEADVIPALTPPPDHTTQPNMPAIQPRRVRKLT